MEDAAEKLDELARAAAACTKCTDIVACRLRALSGTGHPHAQVMFVSLSPSLKEEAGDLPAGTDIAAELAEFVPALANGGRDKSYFTTIVKCVPRSDKRLRKPRVAEKENCLAFSRARSRSPHRTTSCRSETRRRAFCSANSSKAPTPASTTRSSCASTRAPVFAWCRSPLRATSAAATRGHAPSTSSSCTRWRR